MIAMSILSTILGVIVGLCGYTAFRLSPLAGKKLYSRIKTQYLNVSIAIYVIITIFSVSLFYIIIESEFLHLRTVNIDLYYLFSNNLFASFCLGIILGYILSIWYRIRYVTRKKKFSPFKGVEFRLGATGLFVAVVAMFFPLLQGAIGRIENVSGPGFSLALSDIGRSRKEEEFWSGGAGWLNPQTFPEYTNSRKYLEIVGQISTHVQDDVSYIEIISNRNSVISKSHKEIENLFETYINPIQKCMLKLIGFTHHPQYLYSIFSDLDHQIAFRNTESITTKLTSLSEALDDTGDDVCGTTADALRKVSQEFPHEQEGAEVAADKLRSFWTSVPYGVMAVSFLLGSGGAKETAALTLTRWLSGFYDEGGNRKFQVGEDGLLKVRFQPDVNFVVSEEKNKSPVVSESGYIHAWYLIRTMMYLETLLDDLDQNVDKYNVIKEYVAIMKELFHYSRGDRAEYLESTERWIDDCVVAENVNEKLNSLIFSLISRENNLIRAAMEADKFNDEMLPIAYRNADLSVDCIMEVPGLQALSAAMFFSAGFKATLGELLMRSADRRRIEANALSFETERMYRSAYNALNSAYVIFELVEEENRSNVDEYSFQVMMNNGKEINKKRYVSEMLSYIRDELEKN